MAAHLAHLNAAQREAVSTLNGPLLVLAGAGTGKTRVITFRMAELIRNRVAPGRILSVTFTNKAAREMLARTRELLGGRMREQPVISTFHSLCVKILRQDIEHLGYPAKFHILDRGDQESYARKALRDIRVTEKSLRPGDLINLISGWKSSGINPERAKDVAEDDRDYLGALGYRRYQQSLRASGAVDFDDLLLLTEQLFRKHPDVLAKHQQRFSHVQIDEYQDTNGLQFRIIESLVREHHNICVVGDDDQSIYGWRGAEVRHILNFSSHFPGTKVIRLEDNYRCTNHILDMANRLVAHNRERHKKVLRANKESSEPVRFLDFPDEQLEAEKVVGEIRFLQQRKGVSLRDVAILFRTNEQPRLFESELRRLQIPYVLMGSQSFYDRKEIKDLVSYLKAIDRPDDDQALLRIINTPARGIGDASVEKVMALAVRTGQPFWAAAQQAVNEGLISVKVGAAIDQFHEQLQQWRRAFEALKQSPADLLRKIVSSIRYEDEIMRQYKDTQQQAARMAVVEDFVNSVAEYWDNNSPCTLEDYLTSIALERRDEEPDKEAMAQADAVKLMTLHSAKGLEFPRVYLVGMEEGILPHKRSIDAPGDAIAEERRLTYVGVTRAKDSLTLTRAKSRRKWGKARPAMPSRFLREMRENGDDAS